MEATVMMLSLLFSTALVLGQADSSKGATLQGPVPMEEKKPENGSPYKIYDEGRRGFLHTFLKAYKDEWFPDPKKNGNGEEDAPEPPRRAPPSPWSSPPFPGSEYQGYPLIGVPYSTTNYPFFLAVTAAT